MPVTNSPILKQSMQSAKDMPGVLVLSNEAAAYAGLLEGISVQAVTSAEAAMEAYAGEIIVLGEPDLVARALPSMPDVRWVQSTWAGLVPLMEAARNGVKVTGIKNVFGPQMAEFTLGYMLANELGIVERLNRQRKHKWHNRDTGNLAGKTLGVMGTGSIGQAIASAASNLGMHVLGLSRSGDAGNPFDSVFPVRNLQAFLARLDYLVSVLPDTPETEGLLDSAAFEALPAHAVFINVGRGSVVVDEDLVTALNDHLLAGAVLDVFREEPLPADHPFWDAPGLLVTAHVAARSYPRDIAAIFLENYRRFENGEPLNYELDPARGY